MYVTVTRKKYKDTYHEQILLRSSYREDGKVKTKTIANLTNQPEDQVAAIVAALKNKDEIKVPLSCQEQGKTVGFSLVILFIMKLLGVVKIFGDTYAAKISLLLIAARIVLQGSRLQALYWAKKEDKILDLLKFSDEEKNKLTNKTIYSGLDYIEENQEKIEAKLFKSHYKKNPPKRLFYDVTSSYVEGDYAGSKLVTYGYNRDKKVGKKQIVIGLLTDGDGHAISIHTYKGNTNDVKTFADQLDKLKTRFKLDNITIVGDGGMIKNDDIHKISDLGYDYITSIGKPSIKKLIKDEQNELKMSLFDTDLKEIVDKDCRYILRLNPIRRDEIRTARDEKISRLEAYIESKSKYYNTHHRAKIDTLTRNIERKISSLKLTAFIRFDAALAKGNCPVKSKDGEPKTKPKELVSIKVIVDESAKSEIQELDGCYVLRTSLIEVEKDSKEEIHKAYKTLIKVENAFKTLKTDYLEIRPLYLKTDKRIKGHVALSMISYNIILKLKGYIKLSDLDFRSTIRQLSLVKVINNVLGGVSFESIPKVNGDLKILFAKMCFKLSSKI